MSNKVDWSKVEPYSTVIVCYGVQQTADFLRRAAAAGFTFENFTVRGLRCNCVETGERICMFYTSADHRIWQSSEVHIPDCGVGYETLFADDAPEPRPTYWQRQAEPKLCRLLGVRVRERFRIDYPKGTTGELYITEDGLIERADGGKRHKGIGNSIAYAIQNPKKVIKTPRWTDADIQDARTLRRMWPKGIVAVKRGAGGPSPIDVWILDTEDDKQEVLHLRNSKVFPSLLIHECVDIDDILKESHA